MQIIMFVRFNETLNWSLFGDQK